jgi:hypothetical protein
VIWKNPLSKNQDESKLITKRKYIRITVCESFLPVSAVLVKMRSKIHRYLRFLEMILLPDFPVQCIPANSHELPLVFK